jgi:NitT/TauT family transport system ATP-binding protein
MPTQAVSKSSSKGGCSLSVTHAAKSFIDRTASRRVFAFKDISFNVAPGTLCVLFGPNGCGKTTLLRTIAGSTDLDSGEILIKGHRPAPGAAAVLPQNFSASLFPWRTAVGNIRFPLEAVEPQLDAEHREKRIREALMEVGISFALDSRIYELSVGQQQLVALARALAQHSGLLLMDEPFSALDYSTRRRLQEWLPEYAQRTGRTIVLVTHDLDEAVLLGQLLVLLPRIPGKHSLKFMSSLPATRTRDLLVSEEFLTIRQRILKFYES